MIVYGKSGKLLLRKGPGEICWMEIIFKEWKFGRDEKKNKEKKNNRFCTKALLFLFKNENKYNVFYI